MICVLTHYSESKLFTFHCFHVVFLMDFAKNMDFLLCMKNRHESGTHSEAWHSIKSLWQYYGNF